MDTDDGQKPQLFRKGGKPGPGRPKGSKDSISRMTKEDVASFFMECTAENVRWRKHIRQKLDDAVDPTEFHNLSRLALGYAIGLPGKATERKVERETLIFATTHGYLPWDGRAPAAASLNARSVRMIEGKAEEIKVQAETREAEAAAPKDDVNKADAEPEGEALELVVPPPESESPESFGRGR
jgi:hypothetical protein